MMMWLFVTRVDKSDVVKITDAAFAWDFYGDEYVYDSARERYLPTRWMAPESLTDGYYDMRTDVVSQAHRFFSLFLSSMTYHWTTSLTF